MMRMGILVYTVQLISTSFFGCQDTGRTQITVHPCSEASFTADPVTQMMPDRTVTISNTTSTGNWDYLWHFGDDSTSVIRIPARTPIPDRDNYLSRLLVKGNIVLTVP